ncbi:lipid II flippase MurJ [Roseovarius amoyensis]|uniref:lipid II flippase MurJ n=1 Tax=Roseovarius amoyensis TaxID=2211448 RepID=UPI000DBE03C5|nr:lipid II flippase MurJ [Roseovarius amoyensis]
MLGLVLAVGITLLITYRLGATFESDAFIMARRLITGLTELMHRAMLMIFIPAMAAGLFAAGTRRRGLAMQGGRALAVGVALFAVIWFIAPPVIDALGGAMASETRALAIWVTRVMALAIPAAVLANLLTATLNLEGVFGAPALLRLLPRMFILAAFFLAASQVLVKTAAAGFVLGNLALVLGCLWLARRPRAVPAMQTSSPPRARSPGDVGAVLLMIGGAQVVSLIEIGFAVRLGEGALTILELAQRITVLISGAFISATVMPFLARWSRDEGARTPASFGRALRMGLVFLACVQGFFLINAGAVVSLLFEHSLLDPAALRKLVALVMVASAAPLVVFCYQLLAIWNIAAGRAGLVWCMLVALTANLGVRVALALGLMPQIGLQALTLGMAAGPAIAVVVLMMLGDRGFRPVAPQGWRIAGRPAAAVVAVLAALGLGHLGGQTLGSGHAPVAAAMLTLAGSALAGLVTVAVLVRRFGLLGMLRRKEP